MPAAFLLESIASSDTLPLQLRLLHLAQSLQIPIAPTVFIPARSLFGHFLARDRITTLLSEQAKPDSDPANICLAEAKILQLFQETQLDNNLVKILTNLYHHELLGSFVRLFPTHDSSQKLSQPYENITGFNNLIESIQLIAEELLEQALLANRTTTMPITAQISGLSVQTQLPATSSGTVYSKHPLHPEKNVFAISAQFGVQTKKPAKTQTDWYQIHKSTLQEIAARVGKKLTYRQRKPDQLIKAAVADKKKNLRVLNKKQTVFLAALTAKICRQTFLPLALDWEMREDKIFITDIKELNILQNKVVKNSKGSIAVYNINDPNWAYIDKRWKFQPEKIATFIQKLCENNNLPPSTNIIIPKVTNLDELTTLRTHLLTNKMPQQNWRLWLEISSLGILYTLKNYSALDFFSGIILDAPQLLQSLYITPTWSNTEYDTLFAIIEDRIPSQIARGLTLTEIPTRIATHAHAVAYTNIHVPKSRVQKMQALVSELEVQRWNRLP